MTRRNHAPGRITLVFMEYRPPPDAQGTEDRFDQYRGTGDKRGDPAAPCNIKPCELEIITHEIAFDQSQPFRTATFELSARKIQKMLRSLNGNYFALRTDAISGIEARKAGPRTEIDDSRPLSHSCTHPRVQHMRPPYLVL